MLAFVAQSGWRPAETPRQASLAFSAGPAQSEPLSIRDTARLFLAVDTKSSPKARASDPPDLLSVAAGFALPAPVWTPSGAARDAAAARPFNPASFHPRAPPAALS